MDLRGVKVHTDRFNYRFSPTGDQLYAHGIEIGTVEHLLLSPESCRGLINITSQEILEWLTVICAPKRIQSSFTTMLDLQTALVFMMFKFNETFHNRAPELGSDGLLSGSGTSCGRLGESSCFEFKGLY